MTAVIPRNTTTTIRQRWLELLEHSSESRRIVHGELETGVHAVVAPASAALTVDYNEFVADLRATVGMVPEMAWPLRLSFAKIGQYGLNSPESFRRWMGRHGADVASGRIDAVVCVDLAYLEAALLDRLDGSEVCVDFKMPISMFRRGELTDTENVLEAAARMVFEGRSIFETASRVASDVLGRLETYAQAFARLSAIYGGASWRIQDDTFLMELPPRGITLTLRYWELRRGARATLETWKCWIESLLEDASPRAGEALPGSYAA